MIDNKKVGLCISSYVTNEITYSILKKSVISLIHTANIIDEIVIIDDYSTLQAVYSFYKSIESRIKTVRNKINTGIASVKNQGLQLLSDCDIIILSDNDNIFHRDWDKFYCENFIKSNIHNVNLHNDFTVYSDYQTSIKLNNIDVDCFTRFYGNFIMLDKYIIENVGGFPLLPEKYGLEHFCVQKRINTFLNRENYLYDFKGSKKYIKNIHMDDSFTERKNKTKMSIANAKMSDEILESGIIYLPIETKFDIIEQEKIFKN